MKKLLPLLAVLTSLLACSPSDTLLPDPFSKRIPSPPEKLSSMDVLVSFEQDRATCVTLVNGELPPPEVPGDYCPEGPGTPTAPLLYQTERRVRFYVDVLAIGSKGTYGADFPITGNITLSLSSGTMVAGTPTRMEAGVVGRQRVVIKNAPGKVQLWSEAGTAMQLAGEAIPPTFSVGASDALYFGQPNLPDVQRTPDDSTSPLHGQRVTVEAGHLMVTRLAGNGFTVQDVSVPMVDGQPKWNGLFVFAFNGVDNLNVGARLLKLRGAITSFQGMTQLAEPEYVTVGGECAPRREPSRFGREPTESDEGESLVRARCPENARCVDNRCVPADEDFEYDRFGRTVCHAPNTCGTANAECPNGTYCDGRQDWRTVDRNGQPAQTCQVCPTVVTGELWTTPGRSPWCGPIFSGDAFLAEKLRNEALEGALLQVRDAVVAGLDLDNDFFRSGFEGYGQWKLTLPDGQCATVVSDVAPGFNVLAAQAARQRLESFTGTLRQVRFNSGSAFWMLDLRHKDDLVLAPTP